MIVLECDAARSDMLRSPTVTHNIHCFIEEEIVQPMSFILNVFGIYYIEL